MFARSWWKRKGKEAADAPAPALSLALQGGGAHGAYTWGVLDRLLDRVPGRGVRSVSRSGRRVTVSGLAGERVRLRLQTG